MTGAGSVPPDSVTVTDTGRDHCRCGHRRDRHLDNWGRPRECYERRCDCSGFVAGVPTPERITSALDRCQLYGPEVDAACDAAEPDVDEWEAGIKVPSYHQVELLAELTGYPVPFFYKPPLPRWDGGFLCVRSGKGKGCHWIGPDNDTDAEGRLFNP